MAARLARTWRSSMIGSRPCSPNDRGAEHSFNKKPVAAGISRRYQCSCRIAPVVFSFLGDESADDDDRNILERPLPFRDNVDSVLFRLRDQPCPTILKRPYRSCVNE